MLRPTRWYTYAITALCVIFSAACKLKPQQAGIKSFKVPGYGAVFKNDTGYIIKRSALPYLLSSKLIDTTIADWSYTTDSDTIGKYYQLNKDSDYLACILDHGGDGRENLLLFETHPDGSVKKSYHYYYGTSHCCWTSAFDGFGRLGDYFFVRTCGTGAAMCTSDLYLFKTAQAQEEQQPISEWYWMGSNAEDPAIHEVLSVVDVKGDSVTVQYTAIEGVEPVKMDSFDITYRMTDNRWVPNDSTMLHKHGLWQ